MSGADVVVRSVAESLRGPGLGSVVGYEGSGARYWTRTDGWGSDDIGDPEREGYRAELSSESWAMDTR